MTRVSLRIREQVRKRAGQRCEYCRKPEGFNGAGHQVDHIIPERYTGTSDVGNLAWACFRCNRAKSTDIASYDENDGELTPLYHPRNDIWTDHFELRDGIIIGKTAVGRVTVRILDMNSSKQVDVRRILIESGLWD